jgi:hypothetical protein
MATEFTNQAETLAFLPNIIFNNKFLIKWKIE